MSVTLFLFSCVISVQRTSANHKLYWNHTYYACFHSSALGACFLIKSDCLMSLFGLIAQIPFLRVWRKFTKPFTVVICLLELIEVFPTWFCFDFLLQNLLRCFPKALSVFTIGKNFFLNWTDFYFVKLSWQFVVFDLRYGWREEHFVISHVKVIIPFLFFIDESSEFKEALLCQRFEMIFSQKSFLNFCFAYSVQIVLSPMKTGHRFSKINWPDFILLYSSGLFRRGRVYLLLD